jgi:hypothetical protein
VEVDNERHYTIASRLGDDTLVHIINMDGLDDHLMVTIDDHVHAGVEGVYLEPAHIQLRTERSEDSTRLVIDRNDVDIADTILRLKF